jgi:heme exporter protein B
VSLGPWSEESRASEGGFVRGGPGVVASFWFQVALVLEVSWKGMLARKSAWVGVFVFGMCLLVLYPFSFGTDLIRTEGVRTGAFWTIQEFVVALVITRIFAQESEQGALELLLHPGFSRFALVVGKTLFTMMQLLTLQIPMFVVWWALYEVPSASTGELLRSLLPALVLFDAGTAVLGVMLNALTSRSLGREILLPILFFPLQLSILLAGVQVTLMDSVLLPKGGLSQDAWWSILGGFPIIMLATGLLLRDALFEE